jgi:hypothetical protein
MWHIITDVSAEPTITLNTKEAGSSLKLITICQTIRRHIPEDSNTAMAYLFLYLVSYVRFTCHS